MISSRRVKILNFSLQHMKGANQLCQFEPTYQPRHYVNRTERAGQKNVLVLQVLFGEFELRIVAGSTDFWEGLSLSWASKTHDFSKNVSVSIFDRKRERDKPP